MPSTPVYALRYPAASDPADVPLDLQELATDVENTIKELAFAQITAAVSITATTEAGANTVITAPAFTADGTPVLVEFMAGLVQPPSTANVKITLVLFLDGAVVGVLGAINYPGGTAALYVPVYAVRRLTPAAGSRTFSVRAYVASGTGNIWAGAGGSGQDPPAFIRVTRA